MNYHINQTVKTPIGNGVYQGAWRTSEETDPAALVRLPVNEQTSLHLSDATCVTPRSQKSALFVFPTSELGASLLEYAVILAVMALVIFCLVAVLGQPLKGIGL